MYGICTAFKRAATQLLTNKKQVTFKANNKAERDNTVYLTHNSEADGHYVSKDDRKEECIPILRSSSKKVRVANGNTCKAKHVTQLPFPQLSKRATQADTFTNFPTSLMSVGKTSKDAPSSSSPKPASPYTKKQMYSSNAKGLRYSLEYGMNRDNTTFHSSKREVNGNQELRPKSPDTLY